MRFIHWVPPYSHVSAGLRAVHYYCHLMRQCGYSSFITTEMKNSHWQTPMYKNIDKDKDIVIYPEIVKDNPLDAKNIVRYILYYPDYHFGPRVFPKEEKVIYFDSYLLDSVKSCTPNIVTVEDKLTIPTINPFVFCLPSSSNSRQGIAYFKGKGHFNFPNPIKKGIEITSEYPKTRKEVASLLQGIASFYTTDANTALSVEALLCGAKSYIIQPDSTIVEFTKINEDIIINKKRDLNNVLRMGRRLRDWFSEVN